ncbi:histidine kinase dimerization/phospho-acceptor domain-containing protein [Parvibaculum sp.]|jgi:two-component system, cell cycle sensor histidine kinase PleC|uniref:histidine kinase dimerization/phospho-acceptor domain-containing protein n=1 Tax=Parvibaculum sp. TaxID=2024848 RepID=UPI0025E13A63|nr:histidine kinase dimerization/phospho-acceptor domain-containing protein [Parvibaculum sp.]|tara:strand:+ start:6230 stop:7759 length:1530 start_codon:yes stop_codon:yes gene_type:complete
MSRTSSPDGTSGPLAPSALFTHVVSASQRLRANFTALAASGEAGPLCFGFSTTEEGIDPLLHPGIDALAIDIGDGGVAALDFLRRVIALGPNAPVIALGAGDPLLQAAALEAGAEDCLSPEMDTPTSLGLAIRRAVMRRNLSEERPADAAPSEEADKPHVTLVQETPEAIVILDSQGVIRFANSAAQDILGRSSDDLVGRPFGLPSEPGEHDVTITRPDGDNRLAEMRIVDTRWGGVPARVAALNDVTVRRKLEQTMHEAETRSQETYKRNQSFFSNVNHDLRTPLTHIIGFSEMMKNERLGPMGTDRYKEYASDIYSSGTVLLDMIEDLLGIAEAEMHEIDLTDEICNLGQLAEIAVASQKQHAAEEGVSIEVVCPDRLPGLRGDARRLRQGLFRLIAEAIHCAHRGSTIRLTLGEDNRRIYVRLNEVRDPKVIQMELNALTDFETIDDPFVSAEDSSAPREESLALSLTRKVMELHGGSLDVVRAHKHTPDSNMSIDLHFPENRVVR